MTKVKATIKSGGKTYVSVEISGNGKTDEDYDLAKTVALLLPTSFNSFHGTDEEWEVIKSTATEIKIQNLGVQ